MQLLRAHERKKWERMAHTHGVIAHVPQSNTYSHASRATHAQTFAKHSTGAIVYSH